MKTITLPLLLCGFALAAAAQTGFRDNIERDLRCDDNNNDSSRFHECEVREQTIASTGSLRVDAGQNGGVMVKGWSQPGVLVRSKIEVWSDSSAESHSLLSAVHVHSGSGNISATGPRNEEGSGWSVSYEVFVPHNSDLDLKAHNGGVHVSDVAGTMEFHTVNGGLHLARLTGAVTGVTVNGGVHVDLMGDHWTGHGLDVTSTNGGVHLAIPESYSAQIEGSTVNGRINSDLPELSAIGRADHSRSQAIAAALGHGGASIHVATTNGSVSIARE